ncbi:MAG: rhomboid family intramembrane serine protease [Pseudomonadota bacterium]
MLIIPLTGKISWRNPPVITIGIILINCFVFFFLQSNDKEWCRQTIEFYFESELVKIEVPRYREYLKSAKGEDVPSFQGEEKDEMILVRFVQEMEKDHVFMKKLRNNEIITPEESIYAEWASLRKIYKEKLSRVVFLQYGFIPEHKNFIAVFTYMFLHGGFMHLLGNMVFLWLVGCVLELGCGRVPYIVGYVISGILSAVLFGLIYMDSMAPLVGASGAISGLIGAYTVLYGKKKVKVFYSLGFYFNYVKVPGIVLLPIWISNEIFQLLFGGDSHIAYVAHIGGLVSGALLGYINLNFFGRVNQEVFEEDRSEEIASLLEEGLQRIGELDMKGARPLLEQVLDIDPGNRNALTHLFNIDKLNPEGEPFHKTAERLLLRLCHDKDYETVYAVYDEYRRIAKHPRLTPDLYARLSAIFSEQGRPEAAEKIMARLLQSCPQFPQIPTGILNLSRAYIKKGLSDKGRKCLRVIRKQYPASAESQIAERLLR